MEGGVAMSEMYVIEEYSPEDIEYEMEYEMDSEQIPVGSVVTVHTYAAENDGWWRAVQLSEPYRDPDIAPYYVGFCFNVKLRPIDPLEAFAIIAKQQEHENENQNK